jgi:hypothetical protein
MAIIAMSLFVLIAAVAAHYCFHRAAKGKEVDHEE